VRIVVTAVWTGAEAAVAVAGISDTTSAVMERNRFIGWLLSEGVHGP
jgi:hypothetical protein